MEKLSWKMLLFYKHKTLYLIHSICQIIQNDEYSCGLWAAWIKLQLFLNKVSLVDATNVKFKIDEYLKYLYQLVLTRFLGIDALWKVET